MIKLPEWVNFKWAVVLLIATFLVLSAVGSTINLINPADVPSEWQTVFDGLKYVFGGSSIAVLFVMLGNLGGYAWNYFSQTPAQEAEFKYEASKLLVTWVRFEVYIMAFSGAIIAVTSGTAYQKYGFIIAGAIGFFVEIVRSTLSKMAGAISGKTT